MRGIYLGLVAIAAVAGAAIVMAGSHGGGEPSGQAIYEANCANCHGGGFGGFFSGAPKVGSKEAWEPLIPKGVDTLTRGQCETCTDEEIRAAVEYMVQQSR